MRTLSTSLLLLLSVIACGKDPEPAPSGGGGNHDDPPPGCEDEVRSLDIPLDYTLASDHLSVRSASGQPTTVFIGPWGAHTQPHTGHAEGNVKSDWAALSAIDREDPVVAQVAFDGSLQKTGSCDLQQRCAVALTDVYARIVDYQLPRESRVVRVEKYNRLGEFEVDVEACPYRYSFGHVVAISSQVIEAMVQAGYSDPSGDVPMGKNLIEGEPVVVPAGTPIARPNLVAEPIDGNSAYATGGGTVPDVPWQDIEWTAIHLKESRDDVARPEYDYLEPSVRSALEGILVAQAKRENNFRYANIPHVQDWLYRAEHVLVATPPFLREPQKTLTGGIGGWYESPEDGSDCRFQQDDGCNDLFSIFRIHQEGALYDASLYEPGVKWLAYRRAQEGTKNVFERFGEVVSPSDPDDRQGTLVVLWRAGTAEYQRVVYRIDGEGRMRMRYGALADAANVTTLDDVPAVAALDGTETCSDPGVVCYSGEPYGRL